jgi:hypothetical protein
MPADGEYAFPITHKSFLCGDGVSVHYIDHDALQDKGG